MRKRLYDRGTEVEKTVRHELTDTAVPVAKDWGTPAPLQEATPTPGAPDGATTPSTVPPQAPKQRRYRSLILSGSLLIFILVAAASSLYLFLGGNQISGDNIQIAITGQPLVGGGEVLPLEVVVKNQNSVPIESATLVVWYSDGTRSDEEIPQNLYEERISLNDIMPGATQTVPLRAIVYGEANDEQVIEATVEYRVSGSNGSFYKEASPFVYRISSSPITLRIDSVQKVASGQVVDLKVTLASNASTPLQNIVLTASYPNGFAFETADPAPVYGQSVWRFDELNPEETYEITIRGVVSGLTEEKMFLNFSAGPADTQNQYLAAAVLDEVQADFEIEQPFIDVGISINGDTDKQAVLSEDERSLVSIAITNTLDETVYDMAVEVIPEGNILTESSIKSGSGFYDSNSGSIRWGVANDEDFSTILPGDSRTVTFTVVPGPARSTASYNFVVNVYARRVAESSAQESLIGSNRAEAKFSGTLLLGAQTGRNANDIGPVPPTVGQSTTYTLTLVAEAGVNDMKNAIVETSLPIYVEWLDQYTADGTIEYNSVSKQIRWDVGDIEAGGHKEVNMQVSITPSRSQLQSIPVLLNKQTVKANDRFTGALLQDVSPAVTTFLSPEMGFDKNSGIVVE